MQTANETQGTFHHALAQDAFHYALMAAGGEVAGWESTFVGSSDARYYNLAGWYRKAVEAARGAGIEVEGSLARPSTSPGKTKARAVLLVSVLDQAGRNLGWDLYSDRTLERVAAEEQASAPAPSPCAGYPENNRGPDARCYTCPEAMAPTTAHGQTLGAPAPGGGMWMRPCDVKPGDAVLELGEVVKVSERSAMGQVILHTARGTFRTCASDELVAVKRPEQASAPVPVPDGVRAAAARLQAIEVAPSCCAYHHGGGLLRYSCDAEAPAAGSREAMPVRDWCLGGRLDLLVTSALPLLGGRWTVCQLLAWVQLRAASVLWATDGMARGDAAQALALAIES